MITTSSNNIYKHQIIIALLKTPTFPAMSPARAPPTRHPPFRAWPGWPAAGGSAASQRRQSGRTWPRGTRRRWLRRLLRRWGLGAAAEMGNYGRMIGRMIG